MNGDELLARYRAGERDFQDADLCGADLQCVELEEINLRDADLRGANLQGANLRGANLHFLVAREGLLSFAAKSHVAKHLLPAPDGAEDDPGMS